MKFQVPSLKDSEAAESLKKMLLTSEPDATIDIDVQEHTVTVESEASPETFKQLIMASGHEVEE